MLKTAVDINKNFKNNYLRILTYASFILIWLFIFILNSLTPMTADDFYFSQTTHETGVFSVVYATYVSDSARILAQCLNSIFYLSDKWLFNIVNSTMYVTLIWLIYFLGTGKSPMKSNSWFSILAIHCMLWFLLPLYGQWILWQTAACVFLWGSVWILLFLAVYRGWSPKKLFEKRLGILVLFILGVAAGISLENFSPTAILCAIAIYFCQRKNPKIRKSVALSGIAGAILGFSVLISAPGNFSRAGGGVELLFQNLPGRFIQLTESAYEHYSIILIVFFVLLVVAASFHVSLKSLRDTQIYFVSAIICHYALIFCPRESERALFGVYILLILACVSVLKTFSFPSVFPVVALALVVFSALTYLPAVHDIYIYQKEVRNRDTIILEQVEEGKTVINAPIISISSKYVSGYGLIDLYEWEDGFFNKRLAQYYHVDQVIGIN